MGAVRFGPPEDLVLFLRDNLNLKCFVETGTYRAQTATWASGHFESVITIEMDPTLWRQTSAVLKARPNVISMHGASELVLAEIIPSLPNSVFGLDAHWSGVGTAGVDSECPLLLEIQTLAKRKPSSVILIDDARLFLMPPRVPHNPWHWPTLEEIIKALGEIGQFYTIVIDDVIVAVPADMRAKVMSFLRGETHVDNSALLVKPAFGLLHQSPGAYVAIGADASFWAKNTPIDSRVMRMTDDRKLPTLNGKSGQVLWLYLGHNIDAARTLAHFEPLLKYSRIDVVQTAARLPESAAALLQKHGYVAYVMRENGFAEAAESPAKADFFAHSRLDGLLRGLKPKMPDLNVLFDAASSPRGVIHVGANVGNEVQTYIDKGLSPIVLIEANPDLVVGLRERFKDQPQVIVEHCAATDTDGTITLRITSSDQSSSILPLKLHARYYPSIVAEKETDVPGKRLDLVLEQRGLQPAQFGFINLDIQGAELKALRGAEALLPHLSHVYVEVNFAQLYEGCAEIEDLDDFLGSFGFKRVLTACPFHPTWGDALYLRS